MWSRVESLEKTSGTMPDVFLRGDGGIRTLVPRRANAFRVRPVMTASIRLLVMNKKVYYNTIGTNVKITALNYNTNLSPKSI